jgi:hypothetical protein
MEPESTNLTPKQITEQMKPVNEASKSLFRQFLEERMPQIFAEAGASDTVSENRSLAELEDFYLGSSVLKP